MSCTLGELAKHIGAELYGEKDYPVNGIATLEEADADSVSFLSNRKYIRQLSNTSAAAVILARDHLEECPTRALVVDDPYLGYAMAASLLYPEPGYEPGIHSSACLAESATISDSACIEAQVVIGRNVLIADEVYIGPGVIIADNVRIGPGSRILANVTICQGVNIGARALIHPGVVIGADGFGLAETSDGSWFKIPQVGAVDIRDDVEIGANTTIDRGALGDTIIEKGVKIDNQVQIGHNVYIGEFTAVAGCTGIAGSATIGKRCRIGGGCGISGHLRIADDVILTAMSGVNNSITKPGIYSSPLSVTDNHTWRKNVARFHKLDESFRKIREEMHAIRDIQKK